MLLLPCLRSLLMPRGAGTRATGCSEIQGLPCSLCCGTALCWRVGPTSSQGPGGVSHHLPIPESQDSESRIGGGGSLTPWAVLLFS